MDREPIGRGDCMLAVAAKAVSVRILIYGINFHPEPTGIGKYTGEMTNWLAGRGHEVRCCYGAAILSAVARPPAVPCLEVFKGALSFAKWNGNGKTTSGQHAEGPCAEIFRCPIWVPENRKARSGYFT